MKNIIDAVKGKTIYMIISKNLVIRVSKEALIDLMKDMKIIGADYDNLVVHMETERSIMIKLNK